MKAQTAPTVDAPAGKVVHLVDALAAAPVAPRTIEFGRRTSASAAAVLWILIAAAAVGTAVLLFALWTGESPGWWFTLIFTAMPTLFLVGCVVALLESRRLARLERRLSQQWVAQHDRIRPTDGRVTGRDVQLMEHGSVSSFTITAATDDGQTIRARWFRASPANADETLLQPQVPVIGSAVRVWAAPGSTEDDPLVVEALDPSIVPRREP